MANTLKFLAATITLFILSLWFSGTVYSQVVNDIRIETNTGGNSVSNQPNSTVTTGDTKTSININNSANTTATNSAESSSNTSLNISSDGGGTNQVVIRVGGQIFELTHQNDTAILRTTNANGIVEESEFPSGQTLSIQLENGLLTVQPSANQFILNHNNIQTNTSLPLILNQEDKTVSVAIGETTLNLKTFPEQAQEKILDEKFLDEIQGVPILLQVQNQVVYEFTGTKTKKLLALLDITIPKTVQLSTQDPSQVNIKIDSLTHKILNLLSV